MKKIDKIEFQIKGVELLDSSISTPDPPLPSTTTFQFDIKLEHRIALESNLIIVLCSAAIFDDSKEFIFGSIRSSCVYEINDLQSLSPGGEKIDLPPDFIFTINSIAISTTRGMMFSLFRGTYLHNAILPVIDPKAFSQKNQ